MCVRGQLLEPSVLHPAPQNQALQALKPQTLLVAGDVGEGLDTQRTVEETSVLLAGGKKF